MDIFDFDRALLRAPAPSVVDGIRSGGPAPTFEAIVTEHIAYAEALEAAGLTVEILPPLDDYPDSIFVEDPALTFAEGAIMLRPGTATRIGEAEHLRTTLTQRFDALIEIDTGHVDGGDVLVTPDLVLIGLSERTDRKGATTLTRTLDRFGRRSRIVVPPKGVLHLKTAVTLVDEETVLTTQAIEESGLFARFRQLVVPADETPAANALRLNDHLLISDGFPRTHDLLDREGYTLTLLPTEHINRIDAGLTCLSLRWKSRLTRH